MLFHGIGFGDGGFFDGHDHRGPRVPSLPANAGPLAAAYNAVQTDITNLNTAKGQLQTDGETYEGSRSRNCCKIRQRR